MTRERDYSSAWQAEAASKKEFPPSAQEFPRTDLNLLDLSRSSGYVLARGGNLFKRQISEFSRGRLSYVRRACCSYCCGAVHGRCGLRQRRRTACASCPRRSRAPRSVEARLQTRICHAGSACTHRLRPRDSSLVDNRQVSVCRRRHFAP